MYPWIDLYFIKIPSFGLMVALAFLICNALIKKECEIIINQFEKS